uniref:Uncharacterized protein n=1 Tax=Arundo donax TaxID=35708 RepID=A0A0A9E257_ARUDO
MFGLCRPSAHVSPAMHMFQIQLDLFLFPPVLEPITMFYSLFNVLNYE